MSAHFTDAEDEPQYFHSSQRHFFRDAGGTCAFSEYMKIIQKQLCGFAKGQKSFVHTSFDTIKRGATITFNQILVGTVEDESTARVEALYDSSKREANVDNFILRNQ